MQSYGETSFKDAPGLPRTDKFLRAWETTRKAIQPYADRIRQQHIRALYLEQSDAIAEWQAMGESAARAAIPEGVTATMAEYNQLINQYGMVCVAAYGIGNAGKPCNANSSGVLDDTGIQIFYRAYDFGASQPKANKKTQLPQRRKPQQKK